MTAADRAERIRLSGTPLVAVFPLCVAAHGGTARADKPSSRECVGSDALGLAALLGGHVRDRLEDSPHVERGEPATSNAQQAPKVRTIIEALGLEVATPARARETPCPSQITWPNRTSG
jgi:hypothetical protein